MFWHKSSTVFRALRGKRSRRSIAPGQADRPGGQNAVDRTRRLAVLGLAGLLGGCSVPLVDRLRGRGRKAPAPDEPAAGTVPVNRPGPDTVRPRPRAAAASRPGEQAAEVRLGEATATLGDPSRPGLWAETPLVDRERPGRIVWKDNGNSVAVTLIPRDPAQGAGASLSLQAMRTLGVPLTALVPIVIYGR